MIKKITKTYIKHNKLLLKNNSFNNIETRTNIKLKLENDLQNCKITCDETNNPPDIIDKCICVARIEWLNMGMKLNYVDLIFGNPKQIAKVKQESL